MRPFSVHLRAARRGPRSLAACFVLLGLLHTSCGSELTTIDRTQLTLRLYMSAAVLAQLGSMRVQAFVDGRPSEHTFAKSELMKWPVDVQILSTASNDVSEPVEVIVTALSSDGKPLVEQRSLTSSVAHQQRVLELWLAQCGARVLGSLCESNPACRGGDCQTCVQGSACGATPRILGVELPVLDVTEIADPDKVPPWVGAPDARGSRSGLDGGPHAPVTPNSSDGAAATLSCADEHYWVPVSAQGPIPPEAQPFAAPIFTAEGNPAEPGPHNQYICRARMEDGSFVHGKVNGNANGLFDYGCYFARFIRTTGMWVGEGVDQAGSTFELFVPPATCKLTWVPSDAARPLPANALVVTRDTQFRPYHACRFEVNSKQGTGTHIGRVGQSLGDLCRMQYFSATPLTSTRYEVLVQESPVP